MKLVIEDSDIDDVITVADGYFGLKLTKEQALEILTDESGYAAQVYEYGAFDTEVRSFLARIFLEKIMPGREWPTYAQSEEETSKFFKDFKEAASIAGYEISLDQND